MRVKEKKCTLSEHAIQLNAVRRIKQDSRFGCPVIICNPFSELQLHYSGKAAKYSALSKAHAAGWEKSQCDLILIGERNGFAGLAVELKRQSKDPFRPFRGAKNGKPWFEMGEGEEAMHVRAQAQYLSRMMGKGYYACFASGWPQVNELLTNWCTGNLRKEEYHFSHGWEAENVIYRV